LTTNLTTVEIAAVSFGNYCGNRIFFYC